MKIEIQQVVKYRNEYPDPGETYREWAHDTHVIAMHLRTAGRCVVGSEVCELQPPYLVVVAAGERDANGMRGLDEAYWCRFSGDVVAATDDGLRVSVQLGDLRITRSHFLWLNPTEAGTLTPLFTTLHRLASRPDIASQLRARACLLQLLAAWAGAPADGPGNRAEAYRALIEQDAGNADSSLSALAVQIGLTPDRLAILFQKEFGMTPVEYRARMRLTRAAQRLAGSVTPVSDIARECGFDDPNYFARAFRRRFGCSPREFARRQAPHSLRERATPRPAKGR